MKFDYKKIMGVAILFLFIFSTITANAFSNPTIDSKGNPKKQMAIKVTAPRYFDQFKQPVKGEEIAVIKTNMGTIKIKLLPQFAPIAVEAFKVRALSGYYNNLNFDKIISNSIIQAGSGVQNNAGISSISTSECNVDARNYRGAVSIAGSDQGGDVGQFTIVGTNPGLIDKDQLNFMTSSGETQFPKYIIDMYKKIGGAPWLDYHNVVFGQVFESMGVVDNILASKIDENNKPRKAIIIKRIDIVSYK